MKLNTGSFEDNDGNAKLAGVLLRAKIAVAGQEYVKRILLC
jgi:hypothetical protein